MLKNGRNSSMMLKGDEMQRNVYSSSHEKAYCLQFDTVPWRQNDPWYPGMHFRQ